VSLFYVQHSSNTSALLHSENLLILKVGMKNKLGILFFFFIDLAATVQPQPPPPPTSTPSSSPFADRMTSLGIRLRDLTSASYISNGNYLTIFTEYTPGSASAPTPAASPLLQSLNRHFGTGPSSLHNPKGKFYSNSNCFIVLRIFTGMYKSGNI